MVPFLLILRKLLHLNRIVDLSCYIYIYIYANEIYLITDSSDAEARFVAIPCRYMVRNFFGY